MSPLTCSLLALAALLAVATALPDPFCGELVQGERTDIIEAYNMDKRHGGNHFIEDRCTNNNRTLVGQHIVVCNYPESKPAITPVDDVALFMYQEVNVDCPSNTYGCEDITIEVTQYCDFISQPEGK